MAAAINDSGHRVQKNINHDAIKAKKNATYFSETAFLPSLLGNGAQIRSAHQPVASEQEERIHLSHSNIPEAALLKRLLKVLWAKEVEVEPAHSTTGLSRAT